MYHSFYKGGEIAGSLAALGAVIGWISRFIWRAGKGVVDINKNVNLLMDTYFPALRGSVETMQRAQDSMGADVKMLKFNHAETVKSFDNLHDAFIMHLENASREHVQIETRRISLAVESNARITSLENVAADPRLVSLEEADTDARLKKLESDTKEPQ
jgi:hypothetical protein